MDNTNKWGFICVDCKSERESETNKQNRQGVVAVVVVEAVRTKCSLKGDAN